MWMVTEGSVGPIVNGYSGHIWQQTWYFRDATEALVAGELEGLAAGLQAYGIRVIAVDQARVSSRDRALWQRFADSPRVTDVKRTDQHLLMTLAKPASPAAARWSDLETTILVDAVEPGSGFIGTLVLHNSTTAPWTPPGDSRIRRLTVQWLQATGADGWSHETDMLPPPFLRPGQVHAVPIHGFAPSAPGRYVLRVSADGERLIERRVQVRSVGPTAFEASVDGMLANLSLRTPASFTTYADASCCRCTWTRSTSAKRVGTMKRISVWAGAGGRSMRMEARPNSRSTKAVHPCSATSSVPPSQGLGTRSPGISEHRTSPDAMSCAFPC